MIIIFNPQPLNQKTGKGLAKSLSVATTTYPYLGALSSFTGDTLIFLDVSGDGDFQERDSKKMVEDLIASQLPKTVKKILFYISDINSPEDEKGRSRHIKNLLMGLAEQIKKQFKKYDREIEVFSLGDLNGNYITLLLEPPEKDRDEWKLYGFTAEALATVETYSIETLKKNPDKKLLWRGVDLQVFFEKQQEILSSGMILHEQDSHVSLSWPCVE